MPATTYTLTGPSSGDLSTAATFTVQPDAAWTGTVTPASTGAYDTISPATLTWSAEATAKTFTLTPKGAFGSRTISATNAGSPTLTNPAGLSFLGKIQLGSVHTIEPPAGLPPVPGFDPAIYDHPPNGIGPDLGGASLFDPADPWRQDISAAPVHPESALYIDRMGAYERNPDGSGRTHYDRTLKALGGRPFGYAGLCPTVVPGTQALVAIEHYLLGGLNVDADSPDGPPPPGSQTSAPIPADPAPVVESWDLQGAGTPHAATGMAYYVWDDQHMLLVRRDESTGGIKDLWELYSAWRPPAFSITKTSPTGTHSFAFAASEFLAPAGLDPWAQANVKVYATWVASPSNSTAVKYTFRDDWFAASGSGDLFRVRVVNQRNAPAADKVISGTSYQYLGQIPYQGAPTSSSGGSNVSVVLGATSGAISDGGIHLEGGGSWTVSSGICRKFTAPHLYSDDADGTGSSDMSGMPVLPGVQLCSELSSPLPINHAFRVTMAMSRRYGLTNADHVPPARTSAGNNAMDHLLPAGARLRLKASVTIPGANAPVAKMLAALKAYGIIMADNGTNMSLTADIDRRWPTLDMSALSALSETDFELLAWPDGYTVTGPSGGPPGVAQTFTITLAEPAAGISYIGIILRESADGGWYPVYTDLDAGLGGLLNGLPPNAYMNSIALSGSTPSTTFTYTPSGTGTRYLHFYDTLGRIPPGPIAFASGSGTRIPRRRMPRMRLA